MEAMPFRVAREVRKVSKTHVLICDIRIVGQWELIEEQINKLCH